MAGNPLVVQGTLNRLIGSVTIPDFPQLTVTAPFLGKAGISLALEGETTNYFPTMTGAVTSLEPYQMCSVTIPLLKTQNLANLFKQRMELSALLGDITVKPDTLVLGTYPIINSSIESVRELSFGGQAPEWVAVLKGYYNINSTMWNLQ